MVNNGCTSPVGPPCFNPESSSWEYAVSAAAAGSYYLTANFSTYHMNQDLCVSDHTFGLEPEPPRHHAATTPPRHQRSGND